MKQFEIESIGLQNFKSFRDYTRVDLKNLTVFSGLNSAGKSSIYQALLLLIQSLRHSYLSDGGSFIPSLELNGELISLGDFSDILNDKKKKLVWFDVSLKNGTEMKYVFTELDGIPNESDLYHFFPMDSLSFELTLEDGSVSFTKAKSEEDGWTVESLLGLSFGESQLPFLLKNYLEVKSRRDLSEDEILREHVSFKGIQQIDMRDGFISSFLLPIEQLRNCISEDFSSLIDLEEVKQILEKKDLSGNRILIVNSYSQLEKAAVDSLSTKVEYIEPFRGFPKKYYYRGSDRNYELFLKPVILKNVNIHSRYDFEKDKIVVEKAKDVFDYWFVHHFGLADKIDINPALEGEILQIFLEKGNKTRVPINHVGFGTGQIVPVIYRLLVTPPRLFIVDEPEIHLHPSLQSKLADFFVHMAMTGKQIILETHSEHLINRLIYWQLKYPQLSQKMQLFWVSHDGSKSTIKCIETDELGFIVNAPEGFMDETPKLISEINDLRFDRMDRSE